jgi:hypothetical protein
MKTFSLTIVKINDLFYLERWRGHTPLLGAGCASAIFIPVFIVSLFVFC